MWCDERHYWRIPWRIVLAQFVVRLRAKSTRCIAKFGGCDDSGGALTEKGDVSAFGSGLICLSIMLLWASATINN